MLKKYVKTKPTQAILMLLVLVWSVYEIGATSLANNSSLTKEFMHSRYVMVWPMVDRKVKLYHYAEEWTTPALKGLMHLDYKATKIRAYPSKSGNQVFATYSPASDTNNYEISFPLDGALTGAYFSTVDSKYYLSADYATIIEQKTGKTVEELTQDIDQARQDFLHVLGKMKIVRLLYLVLRLLVLFLCIKWSGERRKFKEEEQIPNRP